MFDISDRRVFTVDDVAKIKTISDVRISPEGTKVAFAVELMNLEANRQDRDVYLVSTSGGEPVNRLDALRRVIAWFDKYLKNCYTVM